MNAPNQNCPDESVLQELAAGIVSPELAQQTMQHVARCSQCGPLLRKYIKDFSDERSPEDISLIKQLKSSKPRWQKRLVRDLIGTPKRMPWWKLTPALAGLALLGLMAIEGPTLLASFKVNRAQKEISSAFTVRRTIEPRLSHTD